MEKKKGCILYFDVLGYKNLVRNNTDEENKKFFGLLNRFSEIYAQAAMLLNYGSNYNENKFFKRAFSDNFLLVYELEKTDFIGLKLMQMAATRIQHMFLCAGYLIRGSISYGEIFYSKDLVFGESLIHAYELEEGHKSPSIVVDPELEKVFEGTDFPYQKEVDMFDVWSDSLLDYEDCVEGIQKCLERLNRSCVDDGIIGKMQFVIQKLNDYFSEKQQTKYKLTKKYILEKE